ncbi:MAG: hypothetical protein QM786_04850 [Breznakibacter sp.]
MVPRHTKFRHPDKIAFATDLKDIPSDKMVEPLRDMAHMFHAPLLFVNVMEDEYINRIEAEEQISEHFPGINISFNFIEDDDVVQGINSFMEDNEIEMVAMVRHRMGMIDRLFHPSVTKQMVLRPERPMLILHDG